jgi:hypothetical protein
MLLLWSFNLEKGREMEYKNFIAENLEKYRKHTVPGWTLKGVYGSTFNIGRHDVTWIWEFSKFGDMDVVRDHIDPVLDDLSMEEADFFVPGSSEVTILREVGEWSVLPPKKTEGQKK